MITIKIKTWKDWKKDFIEWVKEPGRKTCKEYVDEAVEKCVAACAEETRKLIDECQPAKFF